MQVGGITISVIELQFTGDLHCVRVMSVRCQWTGQQMYVIPTESRRRSREQETSNCDSHELLVVLQVCQLRSSG